MSVWHTVDVLQFFLKPPPAVELGALQYLTAGTHDLVQLVVQLLDVQDVAVAVGDGEILDDHHAASGRGVDVDCPKIAWVVSVQHVGSTLGQYLVVGRPDISVDGADRVHAIN